jgi:hypothetical protein
VLDDYSLSAKQRLKAFCKDQQPGLGLTDSNIRFSLPEANVHSKKNTFVTVFYSGAFVDVPTRVLHYDRLDLSTFLHERLGPTLHLNAAGLVTTHDALNAILAQCGIAFDPEDIVLQAVDGAHLNIRAARTSLGWTGGATFELASTDFTLDDGSVYELDDGSFFELDSPEVYKCPS